MSANSPDPASAKRRGFRCRIGLHAWEPAGTDRWECECCGQHPPTCPNCGGEHRPGVITICIVRS